MKLNIKKIMRERLCIMPPLLSFHLRTAIEILKKRRIFIAPQCGIKSDCLEDNRMEEEANFATCKPRDYLRWTEAGSLRYSNLEISKGFFLTRERS